MITPETVDTALSVVAERGFTDKLPQALRDALPGIHVTVCHDDELGDDPPHREVPGVAVYLVGGDGHCLSLVRHAESASGLLIAEVEED